MTSSNLKISGYLSRYLKRKWALLQLTGSCGGNDRLEQLEGFRDILDSDWGDVDILENNRFRIIISKDLYENALIHDYALGYSRIGKQFECVKVMLENKGAVAWVLTTGYYCAFYSAIEALRVLGRFVHYLDDCIIRKLFNRASRSNNLALEAGTYIGTASFDAITNEYRITYAKTRSRHHVLTWSQTHEVLSNCFRRETLDGEDRYVLDRLLRVTNTGSDKKIANLSEIRNTWNYTQPALYGPAGERRGAEFCKLVVDPVSAYRWGQQVRSARSPEVETNTVALAVSVFSCLHKQLYDQILPSSIAGNCLPKDHVFCGE